MNQGDKIYANTPSSGSPLGFNTLFTRLEQLRQLHVQAAGQTNSTNISTPFTTSVANVNQLIDIDNINNALNNNLTTLKKSTWYVSNTANTTTNLNSQFSSNLTVPSAGELIKATNFNTLNNEITELESICPVYATKYGTQYADAYTDAYFGFYFNQYGTQYASQYLSQYISRYGTAYVDDYNGKYRSRSRSRS